MTRGLRDPRRFIVLELVETQGVQLRCLDCQYRHGVDRGLVKNWRHDSARLDELIQAAQDHEREAFHDLVGP